MATWTDITNDPAWQDFSPEQRSLVREHFYNTVAAPMAGEDADMDAYRKQFDDLTAPSLKVPEKPSALAQAFYSTPIGMGIGAMMPGDTASQNFARGMTRALTSAGRGVAISAAGASQLLNPMTPDAGAPFFSAADKLADFEKTIPQAQSTSGRVAEAAGALPIGFLTAGVGSAGAVGQDALRAGDSLSGAERRLGLTAAADELGMGIGKIGGGSLVTRVVGQGAASGALGQASRVVDNQFSTPDQQRAFDPMQLGIDVGSGALGGTMGGGHESAPLKVGDEILSTTNTPNTRGNVIAQGVRAAGANVSTPTTQIPLRYGVDLLATGNGTDAIPTPQYTNGRATPTVNTDAGASAQRASSGGQLGDVTPTIGDVTAFPNSQRQPTNAEVSGRDFGKLGGSEGASRASADSNAPASLDPDSPEFRNAYHDAIDPNLANLPDEHRDPVVGLLTAARVGGEPFGVKNMVDFAAREKLGVLPRVVGNIDADGFKAINDTFGHEAGDEVIRQIGQTLADSFGTNAAWHRSGDEFHVGADTPEGFDQAQRAAQDAASKIVITATMPDGSVITRTGVGLSFGRGATTGEAEHGLQADKATRLAAGLRTERRATSDATDAGQGQSGPRVGLQPPAAVGIPGRGEASDPRTGVRTAAQRTESGASDSAQASAVEHTDTPTPQAAAMPTAQDALRAIDRAVTERTTKGSLHDFLLKTTPMVAGTDEARAVAKDFANGVRLARYEGARADKALTREFTPEQQERMWHAADAESVARQQGQPTAGVGLDTLAPAERAAVEHAQADAQATFDEAKRVGMISGDSEALPSYVPRMLVRMTESGAAHFRGKQSADLPRGGLRTMTGNLLKRKYLSAVDTETAAREHDDGAEIVKNIRTLPLATAKLKEAIAGRTLINQIREIGERHGTDTVAEGHDPSKADQRWFTMPDNPAFYTWKPKTAHAAIPEAFDRHLWGGLTKLGSDLGVEPQRLAKMRSREWGNASRLGEVNTRFGGPETVLTHELGHIIDFKYGLADKLARRGATAKELRALADLRFEGLEVSDGFKRYVRKGTEKIANMVHAYVHMPERFKEVAPETYKAFNEFLDSHPELAQLRKVKPSLVLGSRVGDIPVTQWERVPLYVRGDFEGPLRAVLGGNEGAVYRAMMALKQKSMSVIMYSPLIHNAVEWGRALPAMPGKVATFKVYFDGNRAKNDPAVMREAINAGLAPIGDHGSHNDITSIANTPNLNPGRSWTSQVLSYVPGLFDPKAGDAVKTWVDKAGDVWHNTLLWDRVGDLQMGLYVGLRDQMLAKGLPHRAAQISAAHLANRYAGTLPREAMSESARKIANLVLFSRTFTLGNLGAMKDAVAGLPKDARAQIVRDCSAAVAQTASNLTKRRALATVLLDIGMSKVMNALLQSSIALIVADVSLDKEAHEYARRLNLALQRLKENPLDLFGAMDKASPLSENEPGKQDRVLVGHAADGTAIYMRNPAGKIGEEFLGWTTKPLEQLKAKLSTFARPVLQTAMNDKGFGQHVYNPYDGTAGSNMRRLGRIVELFIGDQLPLQAVQGARDYLAGKGDATLNAARVLGPLAGVTFSHGAPGGESVGELYRAREEHDYKVQEALPAIRDKIKAGDVRGAVMDMSALGIKPALMEWYVRTTINPSLRLSKTQLHDFARYATPEERQQMQQFIESGRARQ